MRFDSASRFTHAASPARIALQPEAVRVAMERVLAAPLEETGAALAGFSWEGPEKVGVLWAARLGGWVGRLGAWSGWGPVATRLGVSQLVIGVWVLGRRWAAGGGRCEARAAAAAAGAAGAAPGWSLLLLHARTHRMWPCMVICATGSQSKIGPPILDGISNPRLGHC